MIDENLLKRDDTIYKEIEEFKEFELTQSVAYEMMIRNTEFRKDSLRIHALNEATHKVFEATSKTDIYVIPYSNNDKSITYPLYRFTNRSVDIIKHCIKLGIKDEIYNKNYQIKFPSTQEYQKMLDTMIKRWGIPLEAIAYPFDKDKWLLGNFQAMYDDEDIIIFKDEDKKKFINKSEYILDNSRPKIRLDSSKIISIELNLSLPLNDLTAQIEFLKKEAEKNQIVSKANFYDKEFNQVGTTSKQRAKKWADYFYVYDALDKKMLRKDIREILFNYYYDMGIESKTFDHKTINTYESAMINFIDNMGYKELLTGIKVSQTI